VSDSHTFCAVPQCVHRLEITLALVHSLLLGRASVLRALLVDERMQWPRAGNMGDLEAHERAHARKGPRSAQADGRGGLDVGLNHLNVARRGIKAI